MNIINFTCSSSFNIVIYLASVTLFRPFFFNCCINFDFLFVCVYRYLIQEKRRSFSYNPVAHFHIRNGASVWRLNWLADVSPRGMNQSFGIMTNYRYNLMDMVNNNIRYLTAGEIKFSNLVSEYLEKK